MGVERPSQEFGTVTIGALTYDVVRSPPSDNLEFLSMQGRKSDAPKRTLLESVRVHLVRGTRPETSARVEEVAELIRMWIAQQHGELAVYDDEVTASLRNVLPDNPKISRTRDKPTGQMVEVVRGAMILMDHETTHGGVIRMRY